MTRNETRGKVFGLLAVWLLAGPATASAAYVYDFSFDAVNYNGATYAADSFSFETANLLYSPSPFEVTGSTTGDLNGYSKNSLALCLFRESDPITDAAYCSSIMPGGSVGDVVGFYFRTYGLVGLGTFTTDLAGRAIRTNTGAFFAYTNGSLTIREVPNAVREPGTLALLGIGMAGLFAVSRRRKTA